MISSILRTKSDIESACEILASASAIGCDTETSGLSASNSKIFSVQFSDGENSFLVPLSEGVALGALAEILADESHKIIFHNAKFDLEFLRAANLKVRNIFDTMIAEKILTRGANQSVSLAETLYRHFAIDLDKSQRAKFGKKWDGIWTDELTAYALADVAHLPRLMNEQIAWLRRLGLNEDFDAHMAKLI